MKYSLLQKIFLCISIILSIAAPAQDTVVTIIVRNTKQVPVENATIKLLHSGDSALLFKTITDSLGHATCKVAKNMPYIVQVSAMNYSPVSKNMVIKNTLTLYITLENSFKSLEDVVVKARKPLMRQEDDKTIVDPENIAATSASLYEIMEKTPGIFMDQDGNIYLNSATPALVQINGRDMKMSANDLAGILKNIPPQSILRLEIVRTPSAKYDASGSGGVVNVVLKKGVKLGRTGTLTLGMQQGKYGNQFAGVSLNNHTDKLMTNATININQRNNEELISSVRKLNIDSVLVQDAVTTYPTQSIYAGFSATYIPAKKWELNYDGRLSLSHYNTGSEALSGIGILPLSLSTKSAITNTGNTPYTSHGLSFKFRPDTVGTEWTGDVSYSFSNTIFDQGYKNSNMGTVFLQGDGHSNNGRNYWSIQSDYKRKFAKKITLETGIKTAFLIFNSTADFYYQKNSVRLADAVRTRKYLYNEQISSAYIQGTKNIKSLTLKTGLRGEYTYVNGHQQVPGDTSFTLRRMDLFPYLYVSRKIMSVAGYGIKAYAIYRRTIQRPTYEQLNPFPRYIDPYTYEAGNPLLKPQFMQNVEANISADDMPIFAFGKNFSTHIFNSVLYPLDSNKFISIRTYDNLGSKKETYLRAIGAVPPVYRYFFYLVVQYSFNEYNGFYQGRPLLFKERAWTFFTYHNFKIDKLSNINIFGFYRPAGSSGFYGYQAFGNLNASINRQFLKKKLTITCTVNDVLKTNYTRFSINQGIISATGVRRNDTHRFGLNLRYNFGLRKRDEPTKMFPGNMDGDKM